MSADLRPSGFRLAADPRESRRTTTCRATVAILLPQVVAEAPFAGRLTDASPTFVEKGRAFRQTRSDTVQTAAESHSTLPGTRGRDRRHSCHGLRSLRSLERDAPAIPAVPDRRPARCQAAFRRGRSAPPRTDGARGTAARSRRTGAWMRSSRFAPPFGEARLHGPGRREDPGDWKPGTGQMAALPRRGDAICPMRGAIFLGGGGRWRGGCPCVLRGRGRLPSRGAE